MSDETKSKEAPEKPEQVKMTNQEYEEWQAAMTREWNRVEDASPLP